GSWLPRRLPQVDWRLAVGFGAGQLRQPLLHSVEPAPLVLQIGGEPHRAADADQGDPDQPARDQVRVLFGGDARAAHAPPAEGNSQGPEEHQTDGGHAVPVGANERFQFHRNRTPKVLNTSPAAARTIAPSASAGKRLAVDASAIRCAGSATPAAPTEGTVLPRRVAVLGAATLLTDCSAPVGAGAADSALVSSGGEATSGATASGTPSSGAAPAAVAGASAGVPAARAYARPKVNVADIGPVPTPEMVRVTVISSAGAITS